MTGTARRILFRDHQDKAAWIDGAAWIDARCLVVRRTAHDIAGSGTAATTAARRIVQWVRDHIQYERDMWRDGTPAERIADSATMLVERREDCDGKARLVVALVRALDDPQLLARIRACMDAEGAFTHAQAEVSADGGASWTLAETIVEGVLFGQSPHLGARDELGRLVIR